MACHFQLMGNSFCSVMLFSFYSTSSWGILHLPCYLLLWCAKFPPSFPPIVFSGALGLLMMLPFPPCWISFSATSFSIHTRQEHRCAPIIFLLAECSSSLCFKEKGTWIKSLFLYNNILSLTIYGRERRETRLQVTTKIMRYWDHEIK